MIQKRSTVFRRLLWVIRFGILVLVAAIPPSAVAAISWDGGGNSNWWFDPANWNEESGPYLPPAEDGGGSPVPTDAQINIGTGPWDVTGEGVVFDPQNDPFFLAAAGLLYPTGSSLVGITGRDYGPQTLLRLYVTRNSTNHNRVTIKSGDLQIEGFTIVGRSGGILDGENLGEVIQTGGNVSIPIASLDIGQREFSGAGNGRWEYRGGTLEVSLLGGTGLRLSAGGSTGAGGTGRFVMHRPIDGGHVRVHDFTVASFGGLAGIPGPPFDPDGITTGVGIAEFRHENGGTRPIQVARNLVINNGLDADGFGVRSSRLVLKLDSAPVVGAGGVPANLGLFDVDFDPSDASVGTILGVGSNGPIFSNEDATSHYGEGAIVSAVFAGTQYNWTISYHGNISWFDADNSVVGEITGPGTGTDVVLIGLSSVPIPEPALVVLVAPWIFCLAVRRNRQL